MQRLFRLPSGGQVDYRPPRRKRETCRKHAYHWEKSARRRSIGSLLFNLSWYVYHQESRTSQHFPRMAFIQTEWWNEQLLVTIIDGDRSSYKWRQVLTRISINDWRFEVLLRDVFVYAGVDALAWWWCMYMLITSEESEHSVFNVFSELEANYFVALRQEHREFVVEGWL